MSQNIFPDIDPASTSGTQLATLLNEFKDAYASSNSGDTSRPANLQANGTWIKYQDPDDGLLTYFLYDGAQDIELFQINKTTANIILSNSEDEFNIIKNSDDAFGPDFRLKKGRITGNQTELNDILGNIHWVGRDGSAVEYTQTKIVSKALEDVTSGARGAEIAFYVTETGTSSLIQAVTITDDKKLGVGITNPTMMVESAATDGTAGFKATITEDSVTGPSIVTRKKRVAGGGAANSGDTLGNFTMKSTDDGGLEIPAANIESVALEPHTSTAGGTKIILQRVKATETALTDIVTIDESGVTIDDDLVVTGSVSANGITLDGTTDIQTLQVDLDATVDGDLNVGTDLDVTGNSQMDGNLIVDGDFTVNGTTTTIHTANLDVEDKNITVNDGGTDATSEGAGLTVERTGTDGSMIYADAAATKFKVGAVGSEVEVADISTAQTLSNKGFDSVSKQEFKEDTEANLATYAALTGHDGEACYATDTKKYYGIKDNALVEFGSGGGGGPDIILPIIKADSIATTEFDSTNLSNASFGTETTDSISGDDSYKLTNATGAGSEYLLSPEQTIYERSTNKMVYCEFMYIYDGDDSDLSAIMQEYDGSTWTDIELSKVFLKSASTPVRMATWGYVPSDATKLRVKIVVETVNNAKELIFNDLFYSDSQETNVNISSVQFDQYSTHAGFGSTNTRIPHYSTVTRTKGSGTYTVDNSTTNGLSITALQDGEISIIFQANYGGGTPRAGISLNSNQLSTDIDSITATDRVDICWRLTGQNTVVAKATIGVEAGDIIRPHTSGSAPSPTSVQLFISAQAQSEHYVTPAQVNLTEWETWTPTNTQGFGTITGNELEWRRVGDTIEVQGSFIAGTVAGTEAQIELPDSLAIGGLSTGLSSVVGMAQRYVNGGVTRTVLATTGDTYLNFSLANNTPNPLDPRLGTEVAATSERFSFFAKVPIAEWSGKAASFLSAQPYNASEPREQLTLKTSNGQGSSSTKIRRFGATLTDTLDQYASWVDSATLGTEITILQPCRVRIFYYDNWNSSGYHGVTLNSSELTTNIDTITNTDDRKSLCNTRGQYVPMECSAEFDAAIGDVIRPHTSGIADSVLTDRTLFTATFETLTPKRFVKVDAFKTAYLKDVKTSGTNGGTFTAGAWQTRDLNTVEGDSEIVSLSSNQFTLGAGTYYISASAEGFSVNAHKIKLNNITDTSDDIVGSSSYARGSASAGSLATMGGKIMLTSPKVFELQHRCSVTTSGNGLGVAANFGVDEVYATVKITKMAD